MSSSAAVGRVPQQRSADEMVMDMLADHVPIALLLDLAVPDGPASAEIFDAEGCPSEPWWER